ncbi:3-phosphoshikimate 1-carboxyvinyltransferase [Candidatus Poribacteria bacterium]|nr:3-phosphoshikimate 1-carboxyvinyltransferase [Candidatus Poribacteria bacterium]
MTSRTVHPITSASATIRVPGDKSISHRAAIFGSIATGVTTVEGFLASEDCLNTVRAMRHMGADIAHCGDRLEIRGAGLDGLRESASVVDVGNSGTGIRLLSGLVAGQPFTTTITGDASIRQRPMDRIVQPLSAMGAHISGASGGLHAPLTITGGELRGIAYDSPVASAQVKSATLLAGLYADGDTTVREPSLSRDHTERMLNALGAEVRHDGLSVTVTPRPELTGRPLRVPSDISSAAFFLVAGLLASDARISCVGVGVNPTRTGIVDALRAMGGDIEADAEQMWGAEPVADLRVATSVLRGAEFGGDAIVTMIDELPLLALAASQAQGRTTVRDAAELRVKETDRIEAIVSELRALGIVIEPRPDGFVVDGPQSVRGGSCESHGDHRIAMMCAVAGLIASEPTTINDVDCVNTSFPTFWELLEQL